MNKSAPKSTAVPLSNATGEETVTRSYPEQVFGMDGKAIKVGKDVTLPAPTARRFEARWSLEPAPIDKA